MTEVSSMSETEGVRRPSSLPPPPSERLPQPPTIFVSDTEIVQRVSKRRERRKVRTTCPHSYTHNTGVHGVCVCIRGVYCSQNRVLEMPAMAHVFNYSVADVDIMTCLLRVLITVFQHFLQRFRFIEICSISLGALWQFVGYCKSFCNQLISCSAILVECVIVVVC